jgi:small conductance mechanosensitive channel
MFVVFGVLSYFGVNVSAFAAVLAALGFAVGMALQGTLSNFAAGIMLLVFRPFEVGDYIVVSGAEGTVETIDLFTTRLNTYEKRHLIVPNGKIFGSVIQNNSHNDERRITVLVGTDYTVGIKETRSALESAIASVERQINLDSAQVYLLDLGSCAVNWRCRVWSHADDYSQVKEDLTAAVKESLDAAKIGIPFPQLDVNVVGNSLSKAS